MPVVLQRAVALIATCSVLFAGCSSTRFVPTDTVVVDEQEKLSTPPGLRIAGYATRDGATHPFDGTVTLENDSLVFHPIVASWEEADTTAAVRAKREVFSLPRAEVAELNAFQRSHTLLIIGICVAAAAGLVWLGESMSGD